MVDPDRVDRFLRSKVRDAGRTYERARYAYRDARDSVRSDGLDRDGAGRARIVCRRYAERRAVEVDDHARPSCYEPGHPDCEGCVEDIRTGSVETW
ncbi:DUF7091 family protein [Natronorarus salvus]|uniref:DUF7091 family protein n=1 Tax=Natronorarus salvus TaxID=3117733 RepID=UPI002F26924C